MQTEAPRPLVAPQTARASIRAGGWLELDSEVRVTPLGLIAIGGLVTAILMSVPPIVRAARLAAEPRANRSQPRPPPPAPG